MQICNFIETVPELSWTRTAEFGNEPLGRHRMGRHRDQEEARGGQEEARGVQQTDKAQEKRDRVAARPEQGGKDDRACRAGHPRRWPTR